MKTQSNSSILRSTITITALLIILSVFSVNILQPAFAKTTPGPGGGSGGVTIQQFSRKPGVFPKCEGDEVNSSDFAIATSPPGQGVTFSQGTYNGNNSGTFTATVTLNSNTNISKRCTFKILGTGAESCDVPMPDKSKETFSGVQVTVPNNLGGDSVTVYERNGTLRSSGNFADIVPESSDWSTCGGSVSPTDSFTVTGGGSGGVTFDKLVTIGISFSFSTTHSETFSHPAVQGKSIRMKGYNQNMFVSIGGTNVRNRRDAKLGGFTIVQGAWHNDGTPFREFAEGHGRYVKVLCQKCCAN